MYLVSSVSVMVINVVEIVLKQKDAPSITNLRVNLH